MSRFDISYWLPDDLLMEVDTMTMATSLEARVPFLDHNLLQLAYNVLSAMNLKKRLLKMSVKGILPNDIMLRKKHRFNVPVEEWFKSDTLVCSYLMRRLRIHHIWIWVIFGKYGTGIEKEMVIMASCCGNVCVMLRGMVSTLIKRLIVGRCSDENV